MDANYVSGTGESATETNSFKYSKTGSPVFENYKVNDDVAKQKDLMYAVAKDVPTKSNVSLNFRHALSQVSFKASNENPNIKITIHSVSINGLANTGTFSFPAASTSVNYLNHTDNPKQEDTGFYRGSWNLGESPEYTSNYTVPLDIALTTPAKTDPEITIDNLTCAEGTEEVPHSDFSKTLILLPQERNKASVAEGADAPANDGVYFILNLSIDNVATDANSQTVETNVASKKNYYIPVAIDWSPGNRYIYTFRFSPTWDPKSSSIISYTVTADDYNPNPETPDKEDTPIESQMPDVNTYQEIEMRPATETEDAIIFADRNVGAFTEGESGLYFWWGDIDGFKVIDNKIHHFGDSNPADFSFDDGNESILSYNNRKTDNSWFDDNGNLSESRDAATKYMGKDWRMPTKEEIYWLTNRDKDGNLIISEDDRPCKWEFYKDENGSSIIGAKVTNKKTGKCITLPFTGYLEKNALTGNNGGRYWTASPLGISNAIGTNIQSKDSHDDNHTLSQETLNDSKIKYLNVEVKGFGRYNGYMIRAVKKSAKELNAENVGSNVGTEP